MTGSVQNIRNLFLISKIVVLPAFVFALWYLVGLRENIEKLGGKLLLRLVRPRVKRWKTVWMICAWSAVLVNAAFCVYLASQGQRSSPDELANQATNILILLFVITLAAFAWNRMFLEIREDGLVCGTSFTAWHSILEWSWAAPDSSLRLKLRGAVLTFGLKSGDREIVASALQNHLGPADLRVKPGHSKSAGLTALVTRESAPPPISEAILAQVLDAHHNAPGCQFRMAAVAGVRGGRGGYHHRCMSCRANLRRVDCVRCHCFRSGRAVDAGNNDASPESESTAEVNRSLGSAASESSKIKLTRV